MTYKIAPYAESITTYATIIATGSVLTGDNTGGNMDAPTAQSTFDSHI